MWIWKAEEICLQARKNQTGVTRGPARGDGERALLGSRPWLWPSPEVQMQTHPQVIWDTHLLGFFFFLRFYLFFWRVGKGRRKRERNIDAREKPQSVASPMRPNRDQTHHPGMCPTREPRNQTSDLLPLRNNTQPTEPPWSGRDSHTFCLGKLPAEKWILGKYNTFAQFTLFNSP